MLWLIGILMLLTPGMAFMMSGGWDNGDFVSWLTRLPLHSFVIMQGFAHTGFLLIAIAVIARFKVLP